MEIKGLVWLGTRTSKFEEMVEFITEISSLSPGLLEQDFAVFDLPNGDRLEVFGLSDQDHTFMTCPVAGFLVENVAKMRAEMEAKGIEFIGPVQTAEDGNSWSHFRAPDGHVYEITSHPGHPAHRH
jgi:hypothetical protein